MKLNACVVINTLINVLVSLPSGCRMATGHDINAPLYLKQESVFFFLIRLYFIFVVVRYKLVYISFVNYWNYHYHSFFFAESNCS